MEQTYSSVCANIADGGFVVTQDAQTLEMLKNCPNEIYKTDLVARNEPPVVQQEQNNNDDIIAQLRQENQELKQMIAQLAERIDNNTVNGGY